MASLPPQEIKALSRIMDELDYYQILNLERDATTSQVREAFYNEEYDQLAEENDNFEWHLALSEPQEEDNWTGLTGFIHQVLFDQYLKDHPSPEDCEYYICGPPMMNDAVIAMLIDLGVENDNIMFDDFG